VTVVGLEPSCVAVFRDELRSLFPEDERARRLAKQAFHLSEWLDRKGFRPGRALAGRRALVQVHCHHHAVLDDFEAERRLLGAAGLDLGVPDSGCCGMAGSFGFEREKYEVSMACAERVLLPAVRAEPEAM